MKARKQREWGYGDIRNPFGACPMTAQACSSYERLAPSFTHAFALKLYW
jgi:hypothetical protein